MKDSIEKGDNKMCYLLSITQFLNNNEVSSNVRYAIFKKFEVPIDSRSAIKTICICPNDSLALQNGKKGPPTSTRISIENSKLLWEKGINLYCYTRKITKAGVIDEREVPNTLEWSMKFVSTVNLDSNAFMSLHAILHWRLLVFTYLVLKQQAW